ncbi:MULTISPECIES: class I SAM-dependent methyltransferase [Streptomyces]|uniref:class I SAM-dependent methyltransferase n=1 Tax=Streptomyces TaxID=1883 RepID=UPI00099D8B2E|nr:class I SAM-dependent methyltransferase [Streptomyces sp. XY511]
MSEREQGLGDVQRAHWQQTYGRHPGMYGEEPSDPAIHAAAVFGAAGARKVLELGAGHGRDALYFARQGFSVSATDFSLAGLEQLREAAAAQNVAGRVTTAVHDVRDPLPLADASVDAVFAHMLLCMALSTQEIHALVAEVRRVLRPGGVFVYTVRHTGDSHYRAGTGHGDDIWEHGGFAVRGQLRRGDPPLPRGGSCGPVLDRPVGHRDPGRARSRSTRGCHRDPRGR